MGEENSVKRDNGCLHNPVKKDNGCLLSLNTERSERGKCGQKGQWLPALVNAKGWGVAIAMSCLVFKAVHKKVRGGEWPWVRGWPNI